MQLTEAADELRSRMTVGTTLVKHAWNSNRHFLRQLWVSEDARYILWQVGYLRAPGSADGFKNLRGKGKPKSLSLDQLVSVKPGLSARVAEVWTAIVGGCDITAYSVSAPVRRPRCSLCVSRWWVAAYPQETVVIPLQTTTERSLDWEADSASQAFVCRLKPATFTPP